MNLDNNLDGFEVVKKLNLQSVELDAFIKIRDDFYELRHIYRSAIREVITKLEILNDEFKIRYSRNPIHHIQSRMKEPESIIEKLMRKNLNVSMESARANITDMAGIRVICSYIDDIYLIADLLENHDDLMIIRKRDYIENSKPNGYRSLHLIMHVPVFFSDRKEFVPVEIQIRTIAMDFWASLEHHIRYKTDETIDIDTATKLLECADTISQTDLKMQEIYKSFN